MGPQHLRGKAVATRLVHWLVTSARCHERKGRRGLLARDDSVPRPCLEFVCQAGPKPSREASTWPPARGRETSGLWRRDDGERYPYGQSSPAEVLYIAWRKMRRAKQRILELFSGTSRRARYACTCNKECGSICCRIHLEATAGRSRHITQLAATTDKTLRMHEASCGRKVVTRGA